jgi:hypothetical protein
MFGYMSNPPQPQAKAPKHVDTQTEESSKTQLFKIHTPNHPSPPVGQAKLTHNEIKARGACFYCKNEEHIIRECPKKRLDRLKKKTVKQDPNNNPEDQPVISTMIKITRFVVIAERRSNKFLKFGRVRCKPRTCK